VDESMDQRACGVGVVSVEFDGSRLTLTFTS
jgi:hypothetical protein